MTISLLSYLCLIHFKDCIFLITSILQLYTLHINKLNKKKKKALFLITMFADNLVLRVLHLSLLIPSLLSTQFLISLILIQDSHLKFNQNIYLIYLTTALGVRSSRQFFIHHIFHLSNTCPLILETKMLFRRV